MKLKYILFAAVALLFSSCTKEAISPLEGVYAKPEDAVLTKVIASSTNKEDKLRCFNIVLASEDVTGTDGSYSGSGMVLELKLYGNKYFLEGMTYSPADAQNIKNGFYLIGEGGSAFTRLGGGNSGSVALEDGGISVTVDNGNYTFTGCIWLADETVIRVNSTVVLTYEPEPEPISLSTVLQANPNKDAKLVTLQLAEEGLSSEMGPDFQPVWKGEGYYLAVDIYSEDGYLHPGTYAACAEGGKVGPGEFGIGYDTVMDFGFGPMEMKDWGTCLWTVANGKATAQKILSGILTVTFNAGKWVIELKSGEGRDMVWTNFENEIPAVTAPEA